VRTFSLSPQRLFDLDLGIGPIRVAVLDQLIAAIWIHTYQVS
ncbi:unnamed protein product, partial [Acidithrix sp. C25]